MKMSAIPSYISADSAIEILSNYSEKLSHNNDPEGADFVDSILDFLKAHQLSQKKVLASVETVYLVEELRSRTDVVTTTYVEPYDTTSFNVEGPAVVLEVID